MSENNVVVAPTKKRNTLAQAAVAFAVISSTNAALAASDNISSLGAGASENISAALTVALGIFAVGVGILGTFKGYQYLKSGVNKA